MELPHPPGDSSKRIDSVAIVARAQALKRASAAGQTPRLLVGKNVALMLAAEGPDADLFRKAAAALGARVATIRATLPKSNAPDEMLRTAQMLERLYDAVECQGVPRHHVEQIRSAAAMPVFDGLASSRHASARLDAGLDDDDPQRNRLFVVQAILVESVL